MDILKLLRPIKAKSYFLSAETPDFEKETKEI